MYVVQKLATLFPLRCLVFGLGVVGVALLVFCLVAWFCVLLLCVSAWWNRGILDEVTKASYGRAVTGTAVMARSANEEKKKKGSHMKDFGGVGLREPPYTFPLFRVWSHRSTARSLV